jgi:hypothetical protein
MNSQELERFRADFPCAMPHFARSVFDRSWIQYAPGGGNYRQSWERNYGAGIGWRIKGLAGLRGGTGFKQSLTELAGLVELELSAEDARHPPEVYGPRNLDPLKWIKCEGASAAHASVSHAISPR